MTDPAQQPNHFPYFTQLISLNAPHINIKQQWNSLIRLYEITNADIILDYAFTLEREERHKIIDNLITNLSAFIKPRNTYPPSLNHATDRTPSQGGGNRQNPP